MNKLADLIERDRKYLSVSIMLCKMNTCTRHFCQLQKVVFLFVHENIVGTH